MKAQPNHQLCQEMQCLCSVFSKRACMESTVHGSGLIYCTRPKGHEGKHYSCGSHTWIGSGTQWKEAHP